MKGVGHRIVVGGASRADRQARALEQPWALAIAARLRGYVAEDEELDHRFGQALAIHDAEPGSPFERARTALLYGERLRRARQRIDAREQLRSALEVFDELGAKPWSARARRELCASGGSIPRRDPAAPEQLTPQELQIALQVAEGKTNKDVAGRALPEHQDGRVPPHTRLPQANCTRERS